LLSSYSWLNSPELAVVVVVDPCVSVRSEVAVPFDDFHKWYRPLPVPSLLIDPTSAIQSLVPP
jgi:hypothetical protein